MVTASVCIIVYDSCQQTRLGKWCSVFCYFTKSLMFQLWLWICHGRSPRKRSVSGALNITRGFKLSLIFTLPEITTYFSFVVVSIRKSNTLIMYAKKAQNPCKKGHRSKLITLWCVMQMVMEIPVNYSSLVYLTWSHVSEHSIFEWFPAFQDLSWSLNLSTGEKVCNGNKRIQCYNFTLYPSICCALINVRPQ